MVNLIHYSLVHPEEFRHPSLPKTYVSEGRSHDYETRLSATAPQLGDAVVMVEKQWIVTRITRYASDSSAGSITAVYDVVCSEDGINPEQDHDWGETVQYFAVFNAATSLEIGACGFCSDKKNIPINPNGDWLTQSVQWFDLEGDRPLGSFDKIAILWCERDTAPVKTPDPSFPKPVELPNSYEFPFRLGRNQIMLYVDLNEVEDSLATLKTLEGLGHKPELRYLVSASGTRMTLCALLYLYQFDPEIYADQIDSFDDVYNEICDHVCCNAVHLQRKLRSRRLAIAA
ncbi:MAG: hypothetical protein HC781_01625 [Leptolyngbyaceae cyanobacterium CSU_1_4]|nr:hypothetical protein [Leptolyngbyaceae cyanobacterium CSU_1_4]